VSGIRIHHPTLRPPPGAEHTVYVVETPIEYPLPYLCPLCNRAEPHKSIHLRLDASGDCIVSRQVYEALRKVEGMGGLEVSNEVLTPPPLLLGAVELPKQHVVHLPMNGQRKHPDSYNPGRTKYESRDRIRVPKFTIRRRRNRG
jgi:hypothetical protein